MILCQDRLGTNIRKAQHPERKRSVAAPVVGADREGDAQHRQRHGRPRKGEQAVGAAEQRLAVVPQPVLDGDRDVVEQQQRLRNTHAQAGGLCA